MMVLSKPQAAIYNSDKRITLFLAGVGSGKSHIGGCLSYKYISNYPNAKGFIGANTYSQLNTATMERIRQVWKQFRVTEYTTTDSNGVYVVNKKPPGHFNTENHNFNDYGGIISFINGHVIFLGSLDNAKAHDGKEFDYAILDETKDSKESDVKEIILARLRGQVLENNPMYILTSPAKVQWINEWFGLDKHMEEINSKIFSKTDFFLKDITDKRIIISSTYHNIHNVGEDYINSIINNNTAERAKALVYGSPFLTTGFEYYSSFSQIDHVSRCEYNPELALHISFDQNVVPYTPAGIFQIEETDTGFEVNMIDEITMYHPQNTTEHVCREILRRYGQHTSGTFIYGDATGQRRIGLTAATSNHYQVIQQVLRPMLNNNSVRLNKSNEPNVKRRDFMNTLFENRLPITFNISPKCKLTIDDFMYIVQDVNGGKKAEKDSTGAEKYGHFSDLTEYFLVKCFERIYQKTTQMLKY